MRTEPISRKKITFLQTKTHHTIQISTIDLSTNLRKSEIFDAFFVCNGHYATPNQPFNVKKFDGQSLSLTLRLPLTHSLTFSLTLSLSLFLSLTSLLFRHGAPQSRLPTQSIIFRGYGSCDRCGTLGNRYCTSGGRSGREGILLKFLCLSSVSLPTLYQSIFQVFLVGRARMKFPNMPNNLQQHCKNVEEIRENGLLLENGDFIECDHIVICTGYLYT